MKVVDANVLIYAVNSDVPQHNAARDWLDRSLSGEHTVAFAWVVLLAFLRISTHPSIFPRPLATTEALDIVDTWLAQPGAVVIEPTVRHMHTLRGLVGPVGTAGNLLNDAHLAALAVEHSAELVSFDADFTRFPGLRLNRLS